jgi:hypothetical protein
MPREFKFFPVTWSKAIPRGLISDLLVNSNGTCLEWKGKYRTSELYKAGVILEGKREKEKTVDTYPF